MSTRPLILLGASVRAAAHSANRAGFSPFAIDLFADRDLEALCPTVKIERFPGQFLAALAAAPPFPWIYAGGLENHPRVVDRLATIRPLVGIRGAVLRRVRDPLLLAAAANATGCPFPEMRMRSVAGLHHRAIAPSWSESPDQQWLVKPRRSGGGLSIRMATSSDAHRLPRGTYLQRYIEGEPASAIFVAASGRAMLLGITRQLVGGNFGLDPPFLYVGSLGPLSLTAAQMTRLGALGNVLAERFGLVGLFNIDFVRAGEELWPLEVNPRYSASVELLERITGSHFLGLHASACIDAALPSPNLPQGNRFAGKAIVYARRDGFVPKEIDRIASEWNNAAEWPGLADIPRIGDALKAGQPVLTVYAEGSSPQIVEAELRSRMIIVEQLLATAGKAAAC
jgi:predicted ATP-grasp superfamily ATP-dependent carboligase